MTEKKTKCQKKACQKAAVKKEASAAPSKKRVTFTLAAGAGSTVCVAGDFNNWDPEGKVMVDKKNNGVYTATLMLAPGTYEYKFIINKTWCVDPTCREWVQNSLGTLNSVLRVE